MSFPLVLLALGRVPASSAARVSAVTVPERDSPAAFCNAKTACCVTSPKLPSTFPVQYPSVVSFCCSSVTASPLRPILRFTSDGGGVGLGDWLGEADGLADAPWLGGTEVGAAVAVAEGPATTAASELEHPLNAIVMATA